MPVAAPVQEWVPALAATQVLEQGLALVLVGALAPVWVWAQVEVQALVPALELAAALVQAPELAAVLVQCVNCRRTPNRPSLCRQHRSRPPRQA